MAKGLTEVAGLCRRQTQRELVGSLVRWEAELAQEIGRGRKLSGVNLESNPGDSRLGNINLGRRQRQPGLVRGQKWWSAIAQLILKDKNVCCR